MLRWRRRSLRSGSGASVEAQISLSDLINTVIRESLSESFEGRI